jgi:hypothetical protein
MVSDRNSLFGSKNIPGRQLCVKGICILGLFGGLFSGDSGDFRGRGSQRGVYNDWARPGTPFFSQVNSETPYPGKLFIYFTTAGSLSYTGFRNCARVVSMSKRDWKWLWFSLLLAVPISISQAASPAPEIPAFMSDGIKTDPIRLKSLRCEYKRSKGQGALEEDFMFSWLPARIFSGLLFGEVNVKNLPSDFGLLYWSGFDGGVWLNKLLRIRGSGIIRPFKGLILSPLDLDETPSRLQLIESGSAGKKQEAAKKALNFLASIYGYNRGYLLEILKHAPAGAKIPENFQGCGEILKCHYGAGDQAILAWLPTVRAKVESPPNAEWQEPATTVKKERPGPVKMGSLFWKVIMSIMSGRKLSPDSYLTLLEISRNFLMLNEAVMLKACQAVAERDERQLDGALAADKAFRVSLGGYMVGLGEKIQTQ